jgi:hypothetical protein
MDILLFLSWNALFAGQIRLALGAGRQQANDTIDPTAVFWFYHSSW